MSKGPQRKKTGTGTPKPQKLWQMECDDGTSGKDTVVRKSPRDSAKGQKKKASWVEESGNRQNNRQEKR